MHLDARHTPTTQPHTGTGACARSGGGVGLQAGAVTTITTITTHTITPVRPVVFA